MDLQDIVNAHQHRFSETERDILAFMLENEEFVSEATISSLAHRTFTSTSSIIRLTKKLDFTGFAELKYFIKSSLNKPVGSPENFVESAKDDIAKTFEFLEGYDLAPALEKIRQARSLYCYGTGYAQRNAVQEFAKSMLSCGRFTHVIPAHNEFAGSAHVMTAEDLVIIVSLSGNTEQIRETVNLLSLRKIPMIVVTAFGMNYMSSVANFSLRYAATPRPIPMQRTPFHSFIGLNVLLDYVVRRYIDLIDQDL
ncbi:MurR/RpiR family transcriptional regulator [Rothia sp. ZJ932]|uniref:MurR/RpiR family transcriptional regulator n=1 Tax=Rothia sp. ZJ932 TaxID=2810516 RepID=UPI00195CF002|nr:MurR/RpiR family transcriptional regulator [Rothia sp. ZJ932]MBM7051165.1 MurR/RpiR family transcriptional regulator [Rothia sp. ZJ1223]QRZ62138.1 MurR/RpiR family transcriptional regulator [Rothia sp. ZJ932]